MNITQKGIIALLRSGITGECVTLPEGFSFEDALGILRKHSVVPLAYQGLANSNISREQPAVQKMLGICYRNLVQHERQMFHLEKMLAAFEEKGIYHMPVKGCNIKKRYPSPELRPMGDADILIRVSQHDQIRAVMEELGFDFLGENDHVFEWRSDALYVELHKSLIPPNDEDFYAYYRTGWQLARKSGLFRSDLSTEDDYLFTFVHFARHYRRGGIGCRHLADLFVYRQACQDMDWKYIHRELEKLHLEEFHRNVMKTVDVWFEDGENDETTELISSFIFSSGNWGTLEAALYAQEVKSGKRAGRIHNTGIKSVLRALFPPVSQLSYRYGIVRKCPALLPAVWVIRWFDVVFFRPHKIRKKVAVLRSIDDDRILSYGNALQQVGLDFYMPGE